MGKKRIVKQKGRTMDKNLKSRSLSRVPKKKVARAILHVQSTYNNTKALVTDTNGNAIMFSSAGALGFKGAKKGTPYAAAKVGEVLGEKAALMGIKEIDVVVKGVGSGRESVIRGFTAMSDIDIKRIQDKTPVPFNGPRAPKPRRV
jgi:small subunit ribosomal protein S11